MKVEKGDNVSVEYTGTLDDGTVFDSSKHEGHSHPLEFEVGSGQVIKGFDDAVLGMSEGEIKKFRIEKKDAYGERNEAMIKELPKESLPSEIREQVKVGMVLGLGAPNGQQIPARVAKVDDKNISLDLNNPMAGKDLNFEIEVVKIFKKDK